jgi:predicted Holliday junction resolvase-like endonuclease
MIENVLIIVVAILIIAIVVIHYRGKIKELEARMDSIAAERARKLFEEWKVKEVEGIRGQLDAQYSKMFAEKSEAMKKEFEAMFEKWKQEYEEKIRQDSIQKSIATILGRVGEELAPLLIFERFGVEPKDIRHIGSPIDYIAFKGLSEDKVDEILFIEVKTGKTTTLSGIEREVMKAIEEKRVKFIVMNVKEELEKLKQQVTIGLNSQTR